MKFVILVLLSSCAMRKPIVKDQSFFHSKIEACMEKFSHHGFDAEGVVKICKEVFNRRK